VVASAAAPRAGAQNSEKEQAELAKATQNPIANLTTVVVQANWYSGGDLGDRTLSVTNFQPVLPLPVTDSWNLIARPIVPFVNVPLPDGKRETGIADIQAQLYFTPASSGSFMWGVGPVLSFPTATVESLTTGQFAGGPGIVVVEMTGPWVLGAVANNIWRYAGGEHGSNINIFTAQPFVNYNLKRGWSIAFAPVITANWAASSSNTWTVPLGLGISKISAIGKQPVNLSLQYYNNVVRPAGSGRYQVRALVAFLFPNKPKS
jgi:hypothetical protein